MPTGQLHDDVILLLEFAVLFSCFYPGRYTCPQALQLCNYVVGENVSVLSEPIRSSDPYKQCLDCSVGHERLDTETNLIEGAETKFGLLIRERPQGGRSCRGLLQV